MIKVHVTQEDIAKGETHSTVMCPIARALSRACEAEVEVDADMGYARVVIDGKKYRGDEAMLRFVKDFDNERPVQPQTFEVWRTYEESCDETIYDYGHH